ncbi:MAG: Gfo/Idh/MocA family oxidoreductase [Deltaproteobacteria bacterium]|nr:Gfo/Idh/MocA family oxidoreductase [Deltaproteobacteria bacterium]
MTDGRVRFGLVGCGRISGNHVDAIAANHERAVLAAVCDVVEERARAASGKAGGVPWFTDYGKMLAAGGFDAVAICTPSGMHPDHGIQAAEAGFHVLSEKPIGIALEPVDRLIRTCDRTGRHLFVVMQNRLNPTVKLLRQAVDKGRFGRICLAQVNVFWTRPQEYYDQAKWRGTWEFDGGAFLNQASHYVDLLHWLVGEVEDVQATTATLGRRIEAEDTGAAVVRFRSGAIATMNVTMLVYPKNLEGSITILGERGTARVGGIALNRVEHWDFDHYQDEDRTVAEAAYTPTSVYGHGHPGYYSNVIDVLQGQGRAHLDGRGGRKSLELILAIYRSAREGRRVALPLV